MKTGSLSNDDGKGGKNVTQKWLRFIPAPLICQMLATFQELNSKGLYLSSQKQKENRCHLFTYSKKRRIRHFHVVVMQWRQRSVQKHVMHVQSCCFARNCGVKNSGHVHTKVHTIPETFCARAKIIWIGPLLTHKNLLWRRDFSNGAKLRLADLKSGASHIR